MDEEKKNLKSCQIQAPNTLFKATLGAELPNSVPSRDG